MLRWNSAGRKDLNPLKSWFAFDTLGGNRIGFDLTSALRPGPGVMSAAMAG
ncbi:hypothetical protein VOI32_05735 [Paraburkholderia caribensis]|uniref:Uncharacterized protein n=1 Tax=Paraburkholderia caribensis TaxID=75105 RepID=A0ABV0DQP7_9BURK|nr:hypothetical protein [Paraburkholderia caribensis]MCO4876553.1 hypothetical protein [Paraburkholderia caribensis]